MRVVVAGLEVLGVLLVASGAGLGVSLLAGVWAGLIVSGALVLVAAWWAERPPNVTTAGGGDDPDGAAVGTSDPGR